MKVVIEKHRKRLERGGAGGAGEVAILLQMEGKEGRGERTRPD